MKNVLFYTNPKWVFGKIHNDLVKMLYPEYHCDIMDWAIPLPDYAPEIIMEKYDIIMTTPDGGITLESWGVPPERVTVVAHSDWDLFFNATPECYDRFRGFAVICPFLQQLCFTYGISRVPAVLPIGVFPDNYTKEPATSLETLGYFGVLERHGKNDVDIKRGHLAKTVAERTGMKMFIENGMPFNLTEGLYRRADMVMFCSLIEGNPYVALEAFAAGVPVLGTNTGVFPALAASGGGGILPFDEKEFVEQACEVIFAIKDNFQIYNLMRASALDEIKKYDWNMLKPVWLEYFNSIL